MLLLGDVIVLGDDMIWWGYAGFSGAIVISMAMLASIIGVQTDAVLSISARAAGALLVLGVSVHLIALMMRPRPPKRPVAPPIAVARPSSVALLAPKTPVVPQQPVGSAGVLWPAQKAVS